MTPTISSNAVKTDMQLAQRAPVRAYKPRKEGPMISDTSGYASFGSTSQNRSRPVLMPTRHSFHIINSGHSGLSQNGVNSISASSVLRPFASRKTMP